jgi:hypothetical protein
MDHASCLRVNVTEAGQIINRDKLNCSAARVSNINRDWQAYFHAPERGSLPGDIRVAMAV